jgi:DNA-binding beta-propeller fold protein YncE
LSLINPAKNAKLNYPTGLAIDASNNLYIADSNNNFVRKVSFTSGIVTTVAGRGAGLATAAMEGRQRYHPFRKKPKPSR